MARECAFGIKTYFNEMLGIHLLYNAERSQYDKVCSVCSYSVDITTTYVYCVCVYRAHMYDIHIYILYMCVVNEGYECSVGLRTSNL